MQRTSRQTEQIENGELYLAELHNIIEDLVFFLANESAARKSNKSGPP